MSLYEQNREIAYLEQGIDLEDINFNCHHIITREDKKRGLVPKTFCLADISNLIVLPKIRHQELHDIINCNPEIRDNIETRVWLANLAYNNELDSIQLPRTRSQF